MLAGEHSAGGEDVFATRGPDGGRQTRIVQSLLEVLDDAGRGGLVREVRDLMEPD